MSFAPADTHRAISEGFAEEPGLNSASVLKDVERARPPGVKLTSRTPHLSSANWKSNPRKTNEGSSSSSSGGLSVQFSLSCSFMRGPIFSIAGRNAT